MNWSVYADLKRSLTEMERRRIADVLDEVVADGGCVGLQKGMFDEVYFRLFAVADVEARVAAERLLELTLKKAGVEARYEIQVEPDLGG